MTTVSVVLTSIPGRSAYLEAALESLMQQTRPPDEVVLVLEGDDPRWAHVLKRYQQMWSLRIIRLPEVSGRAAPAKSRGLRTARGAYVALLDDDDLAMPDRLRLQEEFLQNHATYGWVCGRVERFEEGRTLELWPRRAAGELTFADLYAGNPVPYSTVMLRREAVEVLSGFREDLSMAPDYEAWLRLVRQGMRGYLMDAVLGRYRVHPTNLSGKREVLLRAVIRIRELHREAHPHPQRAARDLRRAWRDLARYLEGQHRWAEARRAWLQAWRYGGYTRDLLRGLRAWLRSGW